MQEVMCGNVDHEILIQPRDTYCTAACLADPISSCFNPIQSVASHPSTRDPRYSLEGASGPPTQAIKARDDGR